jgi:hypothetical protein
MITYIKEAFDKKKKESKKKPVGKKNILTH